jgi:outer membrane immunogenic protein
MKKLLTSIAITAGFAGSAIAADLPMKAAPMAPMPVAIASWTGCYVGAGGGYGMYNQDVSTVTVATGASSTAQTVGGRGWFGTVQVGCDYQFADRFVFGVFGDYDFSDLKGTLSWARGNATTFLADEKKKDSWAVGGRLGYVILPQLLGYVSGGYTESRYEIGSSFNAFTGGAATSFLPDVKYKGWFIGTGYEYAVNFLPGLYWKTEYRFASFRNEDLPFLDIATGAQTGFGLHTTKYEQTIRSELVYRFNFGGSGPVVARY